MPSTIRIVILITLIGVSLPAILSGQTRKDLEDRRKRLIQEINQTTELLSETKKNRATALDNYFALQMQIRKRQQLVTTLREEIAYTDASIDRTNEVLTALYSDVERLKQEYVTMLRSAYRHKLSNSFLQFLFSARSVNDAFRRWQYLRQYDHYRKRQARLITETQESLAARARQLEERRQEKAGLLASSEQQQKLLNQELQSKNEILATLKADEKRLLTELKEQQTAHEELNSAIESFIREEMASKRREARTPEALTAAREESGNRPTLARDFQTNKGRLPWPVSKGTITRNFGTQAHPTLKEIMITNNGIDIATAQSAEVYAIFDGKVAGTQFIPGYQNMVIIQHDEYYSVYSNLEEIYVKRGDFVKGQQIIGRVGSNKPEVHFEIWREKQRLNPVHWVSAP